MIEELEIGMYVRTINGKIWIINSQQAISGHKKDIINASFNIIDLIEVGDYVNGNVVKELNDELVIMNTGLIYDNNLYLSIKQIDIKSIVTKEQFERISYEVK